MPTALTLPQIIAARRDALLARWKANPLQQVLVESPAALGRLVWIDVAEEAAVARLARRSAQKVAVVGTGHADPHNASVWVQAGYGGYRGAYESFIVEVYGLDRGAVRAALAPYDVDHLLNRARPQDPSNLIRLEAIDLSVNRSWGSLFEKVSSNPDFHANQMRPRRTMSWTIAAKLGGQMAPSGPDDSAGIDRIAAWFATRGFDRREAREGLAQMLRFAYGL